VPGFQTGMEIRANEAVWSMPASYAGNGAERKVAAIKKWRTEVRHSGLMVIVTVSLLLVFEVAKRQLAVVVFDDHAFRAIDEV
jgi:hypothetical protein